MKRISSHASLISEFGIKRAILIAAAVLVIGLPVIATSTIWTIEDRSNLLPIRDGVQIKMVSERQSEWLLSDGTHLYKYDGATMTDLTKEAKIRELYGISGIYSDGKDWLVYYQPLDRSQPLVWLTDGLTWTELTDKFPRAEGGIKAYGRGGNWFVQTSTKDGVAQPGQWMLSQWKSWDPDHAPANFVFPLGSISPQTPGCFTDAGGTKTCMGMTQPLLSKGNWYLLSGTGQQQSKAGLILKKPAIGLWRMVDGDWKQVSSPLSAKFVSGIWQGDDTALIATTDSVTNPFAADHFWVFDGGDVRDVTSQAFSAGILSVDMREVHASWNGRAWMIAVGKRLVRFDGVTMTEELKTPTALYQTVSSNTNGYTILGGAVSLPSQTFSSTPLQAALALVREDLSQPATTVPGITNVVTEVSSKLFGPSIKLTMDPATATVGNGNVFGFTARAEDADGIARIDIYVNGGRVKSCFDTSCSYTQVYWTNGSSVRNVPFYARAIDNAGYANESKHETLRVDAQSTGSAKTQTVPQPSKSGSSTDTSLIPSSAIWTTDAATSISWTAWTDPRTILLKSGQTTTYSVAAKAGQGLDRAEIWVNGRIKQTCSFDKKNETRLCRFDLAANDFAFNTDVFVNARMQDARGRESWTTGTTIHRDQAPLTKTTTPEPKKQPTAPVFTSVGTLSPNVSSVSRGTILTFHVNSQNNTEGMEKVEVYVNGKVERVCTYGGTAVSEVRCEASANTAQYEPGSSITFMARAINGKGKDIWSNAKAVLILNTTQSQGSHETPTDNPFGISVWSWMDPTTNSISATEKATYTVGAWSPKGVRSIEIVVDGKTRSSCNYPSMSGTRECAYTLTTNDYSDGHTAVLNARITDGAGHAAWSDVRSIQTKRTWGSVSDPPGYATITSNAQNGTLTGNTLTLEAKGWSPYIAERIDIFVEGVKVASCPSSVCRWQTTTLNRSSIEFQSRVIDTHGQETWSGLQGTYRKP